MSLQPRQDKKIFIPLKLITVPRLNLYLRDLFQPQPYPVTPPQMSSQPVSIPQIRPKPPATLTQRCQFAIFFQYAYSMPMPWTTFCAKIDSIAQRIERVLSFCIEYDQSDPEYFTEENFRDRLMDRQQCILSRPLASCPLRTLPDMTRVWQASYQMLRKLVHCCEIMQKSTVSLLKSEI